MVGRLWHRPALARHWRTIGRDSASTATTRACVTWIPSHPGHFCVQVNLDDPQDYIRPMEPAQPGRGRSSETRRSQHTLIFQVGNSPGPNNPNPVTADIYLTVNKYLPGWQVTLVPDVLPAMRPGEIRPVTMLVTPPAGVPMPEDGALVADVEAYLNGPPPQGTLLGGFRKIFRPPIPIHQASRAAL